MFDFQKIFAYIRFLDEFRKIKRVMYNTGEDRLENDTEHSYQLTMVAWYIMEVYKLNYNKDLVLQYCLVHDLVEVYAGDTYIYSQDKEHFELKSQREMDALLQIQKEFPEFPDLLRLMERYEHKSDKESLFVYALDKIIPVMNMYLDNGRTWKDVDLTKIVITIEKLREVKDEKIRQSPELYGMWMEFVAILESRRSELFLE
ncbi:MAG: HD domain-containing protein [Candidatus Gracilibacteria bacterium]|nr:HD domain-containing protein [Candidatus Gracilibacteria bacterium]